MPRYFFNIADGTDLVDKDGTVLTDEGHARSEAVTLAGMSIAEMGAHFWTHQGDWVLSVSDEAERCVTRAEVCLGHPEHW